MLSLITKLALSLGVGVASQIVVKDVLVKLVTVPSGTAMKVVQAVGIGGIGLTVSHHVGDAVDKSYDAVALTVNEIKKNFKKKKVD